MLDYDDRIAVAVSGGKDSLVLLHVLAKLEQDFPESSLVAVSVDEGIKEYRDEALEVAKENCEILGIEHRVVSFKELYGYSQDEIVTRIREGDETGLTACSFCGVLRRKALNIATREAKAKKVATAHNLDDETQTILLNILHGDPSRIFRAKPVTENVRPKLAQRIKPFIKIPERETVLYALVKKIRFQDKPCPYASEAMRNDIRLFLNRMEHKHAGSKSTLFHSIDKIRSSMSVSEKRNLNQCEICGEPTVEKMCRACQMLQQLKML